MRIKSSEVGGLLGRADLYMLRSVYLKTLRDTRVPTLAWGIGLGALVALALYAGWLQSTSTEAKAALLALAPAFAWWADPVAITTPGGYVTWRIGPFMALLPALWALLAGSQTIRGEEQQGTLEMLMAAPISRSHLFFEKAIGLGTALVVIGGLISLGIIVGGLVIQDPFPLANACLQGLDIAAHAAVFGALALFLSQLTLERGTAAGLAGLLLGISFLLDSVGRTVPELASLRYASTIYYFGLNKPLLPGYDTDLGALLVLAGLLAVFIIGAGWLFVRRDVGAPGWVAQARTVSELVKPAAYPRTLPRLWPYRTFWLRSSYTRSLQQTWRPTFWWGLAIGALAATLSGSAGAGHVSLVLSMLPILFAIFAVTQVSRWAYSEPEGRLELLLTAPVERSAALTSAFGALAIALLLLGIFTLAGLGIAAQLAGLGLPWDNLAAAAFGLVPATLLVGSIGFLLTAWLRPGTAIGILIVLLGASLTLGYVGPALDWPEFVAKLSPVAQYGQPLLNGFDLTAMARLVVLAGIALALASFRFSRKDIL